MRARAGVRGLVVLLAAGLTPATALAHEPVFGVGPETIYEGGLGVELGTGYADLGDEREWTLGTELIYGATPDLSLTLEVPTFLRRETERGHASGIGDLLLRAKYRFWNRNRFGASDRAALILGVKLPSGRHHQSVPLGSGSVDVLAGLAAAHESRRWYGFSSFRYLLRTEHHGLERGDRTLFDVAGGFRPWLTEYLQPDLVLLLEFNGSWEARSRLRGGRLAETGGFVGWLGPTALLSHRNRMLKAGVQLPIATNLNGDQERPAYRTILAIEYHF